MVHKIQRLTHILGILALAGCATDTPVNSDEYLYQTAEPYAYDHTMYVVDLPVSQHGVEVPESYHVGYQHTPKSHTDVDKSWAEQQYPQHYTIELTSSDQAASVAQVLYQAPKQAHMAELKYQQQGKNYYKGVYGTYPTHEAAQKALNDLPQALKEHADIKTWSSIQQTIAPY